MKLLEYSQCQLQKNKLTFLATSVHVQDPFQTHIRGTCIFVCVAEQLSVASSSKHKPKVIIFSVLLGVIILCYFIHTLFRGDAVGEIVRLIV